MMDTSIESEVDYVIFLITACFVFILSLYFAYEAYSENLSHKDSDIKSGTKQRKIMCYSLCLATMYKAISMILQYVFCFNVTNTTHMVCLCLRFSPNLPFLTSFSIFAWYLTQVMFSIIVKIILNIV